MSWHVHVFVAVTSPALAYVCTDVYCPCVCRDISCPSPCYCLMPDKHASPRTHARTPQLGQAGRQFDVCLANILRGPLLELAPRLTSYVRPGGHLVLSGM